LFIFALYRKGKTLKRKSIFAPLLPHASVCLFFFFGFFGFLVFDVAVL